MSDAKAGLTQAQFLRVMTRDEAISAFRAALDPRPLGTEILPLEALIGRVLATDIAAACDAPPFDRSVVDGFAVRAADLGGASPGNPVTLALNGETIACGHHPRLPVTTGTATPIATGGPLPRGADAVVMIENTEASGEAGITVRQALSPGQNIAFAGSDIARGQTLLLQGTVIGAREIGMLAAVGLGEAAVWRKPRVAVLSTGDELVAPGGTLAPAQIYDSNGPIVAAALAENGCEPIRYGAIPDDAIRLEAVIRAAHAECDAVVLSGGTSKGAGDLTHQIVARLGAPGIITHGVALKPGKPLLLAVSEGKPVIVLPGFPTSAMFTFHDIVSPVLRRMAGLPERPATHLKARVPQRIPSELGRTEFVMVGLSETAEGLVAHPIGKGSGAVTAFSQADGFLAIDAMVNAMDAGTETLVQLFTPYLRVPDLTIMGSHCTGLDALIGVLSGRGYSARILAIGSLGGLAALRRGECDIAPIHLLDAKSGIYNAPYLPPGARLIAGWRRMQGLAFRRNDPRFEGKTIPEAIAAALADADCVMVNRNQGSGTRILADGLLGGAKPPGYWNQPRSHNAVAASISQGRADWGIAIRPVAEAAALGFLPLADEHYDFAVPVSPRHAGALEAFIEALGTLDEKLTSLGFEPASRPA